MASQVSPLGKGTRLLWCFALATVVCATLAAPPTATDDAWLKRRSAVLGTIWANSTLPTRAVPDYAFDTNVTGMRRLVWDISSPLLPMNATTFYYPANPGKRSKNIMLHHHGHARGCDAAGCTWWDYYNISTWIHETLGAIQRLSAK